MSSKELADRISRALESSGLASPVSSSFGDDRVAVLCRVPKASEAQWVEMITKVLVGANVSSKGSIRWQCHICKHYFLKEANGEDKIVWGWNFSIHAREMSLALDSVIRLIKGQSVEDLRYPGELQEFPLRAPQNRNTLPKGGGAHTIGGTNDFHWGKK